MHRLFSLLALSMLCLMALGCGPSGPILGTVSGEITLEGKPVEKATVEFHPQFAGGQVIYATDKTDADGRYEMLFSVEQKGVPVGSYQVTVSTADSYMLPNGTPTFVKETVPRHYIGDASILTFEVVEGENDASFDLKKKKPK